MPRAVTQERRKDRNKNSVAAPKRVLIVDDDEGILKAVSLFLTVEGYAVTAHADGGFVAALTKKRTKEHPDVILLDMLLSGSDGREICAELKSHKETKDIPIIMFSAHPNAEKTVKSSGADAFISKPFDTTELLKKIAKFAGN